MLKIAIIGCLCAIAVIKGQDMPPPPPPDGPPPPAPMANNRVARQAMPVPPMMPTQMQGGAGPGNLGMQGLGNIPDPTAIVAKAQEVGKQFLGGRRRRQATTAQPLES
ncbi:large proline-rich protein BAG6-like [Venturia canescens]|uniref:large proline-rich protein BAG6-like n=1 Tax=Venturia canescens TaxID=32260 RepID=UPI001C9C8A87|nr:large proline-rich protein BAG6-like [Venturia canescens]